MTEQTVFEIGTTTIKNVRLEELVRHLESHARRLGTLTKQENIGPSAICMGAAAVATKNPSITRRFWSF